MVVVALAIATLGVGCQVDPWVQYEDSLYASLQAPSPEVTAERAAFLETVITRAEERGQRPPPGFCAECALYQVRIGRPERAKAFLDREAEHYPESKVFVSSLRSLLDGGGRALPEAGAEREGENTKAPPAESDAGEAATEESAS